MKSKQTLKPDNKKRSLKKNNIKKPSVLNKEAEELKQFLVPLIASYVELAATKDQKMREFMLFDILSRAYLKTRDWIRS